MVKDRNGQMLTREEELNRKWAEHFEELLNFNNDKGSQGYANSF